MKGKFIKKLIAYALAAAMVVSTPMTAFAADFADNFWVSDGVEDGTDTGTVSNTETGTSTLKEYWQSIEGITVDLSSVAMTVGDQRTLTAEVVYKDGVELSDEVKETINSQIRWRSTDSKVVTVDAKKGSMTVCPINAKSEGVAFVTAGLDYDLDGVDDFKSEPVTVTVTESMSDAKPIYEIAWNEEALDATTFYAGRTYDLNEYLLINGQPYYDFDGDQNWESVLRVAYSTDADPKKQASITQVGQQYDDGSSWQVSGLAISKSLRTDETIKIYAKFVRAEADDIYASLASDGSLDDELAGIDNTLHEATIKISRGVPATRLNVSTKKVDVDFGNLYNADGSSADLRDYESWEDCPAFEVEVTATPANTTDVYTWSAKNPEIAEVVNVPDGDDYHTLIVGKKVGKTTITFTSTSGKKVNVSVNVKATLKHIEVIDSIYTWSGKAASVENAIIRIPAQNTDKLKITVADTYKKIIKVKNQTIVPAANLNADQIDTTLTVSLNKGGVNVTSEPIEVTVRQSDLQVTRVERVDGAPMEKPEKLRYLADTAPVEDDEWENWYYDHTDLYQAQYTFWYNETSTMDPIDMWDALSWTSSNPLVATAAVIRDEEGRGALRIVAGRQAGTAKITLSSVGKSGNGYKTYKVSFNVKSTPVCDEITLKSYDVAAVAGKKVTLSVKQLLPKKSTADNLRWYIEAVYDAEGNLKEAEDTQAGTGKKLSYTVSGDAGDTIVVRVEADDPGIAQTHAYIHVLSTPTKKVQFTQADNKGKMTLGIGELKILTVDAANGDVVTGYSINKSGVVKVLMLNDRRAIVCGVGRGKVTVTAQMASGKKAKTTITVQ